MVNQHTTVGATTRTHDANGNLSDDGTQLYEYDFQNRLVRVTNKATQTVVATYRYDALGRRVEKAVNGGATTRYLLEGVQVVEEYDNQGVWQARYVYEDGIDQPRCMDRADQADVNGNQNMTEVMRFHYHQQALGCVTEMTDPGGAVVEWVVYDVYGQPTIRDQQGNVAPQSAIGNPYLYTGREYDPESGLYFYRARHYDPATGRFLQRDPAGPVDGLGLQEYGRSSPTLCRDPLGEESLGARVVQAAKDFQGAGVSFEGKGFSKTAPALDKPEKQSEHWKNGTENFEGKESAAIEMTGEDAAAAIMEIFQSGELFSLDCATAVRVILLKALLDKMGAECFNRHFKKLKLASTILDEQLTPFVAPYGDLADDVRGWQPGDLGYMQNPDPKVPGGMWQGEWFVVMSTDAEDEDGEPDLVVVAPGVTPQKSVGQTIGSVAEAMDKQSESPGKDPKPKVILSKTMRLVEDGS